MPFGLVVTAAGGTVYSWQTVYTGPLGFFGTMRVTEELFNQKIYEIAIKANLFGNYSVTWDCFLINLSYSFFGTVRLFKNSFGQRVPFHVLKFSAWKRRLANLKLGF